MHAFCFSHHQRHSRTTQTPKENVCVCVVCVLLLKRRAVAERVSLWAAFLGRTATCRLGQHEASGVQRCGLTSDRNAAPRPPSPAHPRQESVHVDFKNGCAENPPIRRRQKQGKRGRTGAAVHLAATLAGSSDENLSTMRGVSDLSLIHI